MHPAKISLEESILSGELSLEKIFNAFTDGVYDYKIKDKITFVSDNFFRLLGYEPGEFEVTDDRWDSLIHPDDLDFANQLFYDHIDGKLPRFAAEYRMLRKDGSYQWVTCTGKLIGKDEEGNPTRVVGAIKSSQSKKQLEVGMKTLIHASSKLKGIDFFKYMALNIARLFQVNCVIITTSGEKDPAEIAPLVMWENENYRESFLYKVKGTPTEEIYKTGKRLFTYGNLKRKYPNDEYVQKNNIVGYYGVPILNPSNEMIGHLCVMNDREVVVREWMESMIELFAKSIGSEVERIENEERLKELNMLLDQQVQERTIQLEKAVDDLDSFFYKASHDLRAPITTLEGIYNLLESEIDTHEKARLFKLLGIQITSIKRLNRSIVEVGNIRNHQVERTYLSLESILKDLFQELSQPNNFTIEKVLDDSVEIISDKFLLETLLREFISNSIMHRDQTKTSNFVRIETVKQNDAIEIIIKDNGKGISHRVEQNYFQFFLRASKTSGFGLGLYKAKLAADAANIGLTITSEEGKGTEVILSFPKQT